MGRSRAAKDSTVVGMSGTDLATRFRGAAAGGGGIQAGAHPELDTKTPMDRLTEVAGNAGRAVLNVLNRLNSTGNTMSPTTKKDKGV